MVGCSNVRETAAGEQEQRRNAAARAALCWPCPRTVTPAGATSPYSKFAGPCCRHQSSRLAAQSRATLRRQAALAVCTDGQARHGKTTVTKNRFQPPDNQLTSGSLNATPSPPEPGPSP